jgi:hypothetical protein
MTVTSQGKEFLPQNVSKPIGTSRCTGNCNLSNRGLRSVRCLDHVCRRHCSTRLHNRNVSSSAPGSQQERLGLTGEKVSCACRKLLVAYKSTDIVP